MLISEFILNYSRGRCISLYKHVWAKHLRYSWSSQERKKLKLFGKLKQCYMDYYWGCSIQVQFNLDIYKYIFCIMYIYFERLNCLGFILHDTFMHLNFFYLKNSYILLVIMTYFYSH